VDNLEKYKKVFVDTFGVNNEQLEKNLEYDSIPDWDSVGHMTMVAALEETFDITLEMDDIIDFSSFNYGKEILTKYNIEIK
jgi:acyl carrier protein